MLPLINVAVMWSTQKLTPTAGMDPMQQKMMQFMPLVFGVMFAFFPAGLVLYWVTNGALGLLQQWWMIASATARSRPRPEPQQSRRIEARRTAGFVVSRTVAHARSCDAYAP